MNEVIGVGETIAAARENACRQLGLDMDKVKFEVIQLPEKKVLGLFGGKKAKVCAVEVQEDKTPQAVCDFINYVANEISDKDVHVDYQEDEVGAVYDLKGDGVSDVMGKYGEVLDSLQFLSGLVASQNHNSYYRVLLNAEGFDDRRHGLIKKETAIAVTKFKKSHANVHLRPMNAYERRVVHELIQKLDGVSSWSECEGSKRHVVIGEKGARDYVERNHKFSKRKKRVYAN